MTSVGHWKEIPMTYHGCQVWVLEIGQSAHEEGRLGAGWGLLGEAPGVSLAMEKTYKAGGPLVSVGMPYPALASWAHVTGGRPRPLDSVITSATWVWF